MHGSLAAGKVVPCERSLTIAAGLAPPTAGKTPIMHCMRDPLRKEDTLAERSFHVILTLIFANVSSAEYS